MPQHWLEQEAADVPSLPPQSHLPGIGMSLAAAAAILTPMPDP